MTETVANYVPHNVAAFVTRDMDGADPVLIADIKDLIENHARSISGLSIAFKISNTGATEYPNITPAMAFAERPGKFVQHLFERWASHIASTNAISAASTLDVLFVELDDDGVTVIDAWRCNSFYPTEFSGMDGTKSPDFNPDTTGESVVDTNAQFACTTARGASVIAQAQTFIDGRAQPEEPPAE